MDAVGDSTLEAVKAENTVVGRVENVEAIRHPAGVNVHGTQMRAGPWDDAIEHDFLLPRGSQQASRCHLQRRQVRSSHRPVRGPGETKANEDEKVTAP